MDNRERPAPAARTERFNTMNTSVLNHDFNVGR